MKQVDAANIILGESSEGDTFRLHWRFFWFKLKIKWVSTKNLIRISKEMAMITEVDTLQASMFRAQTDNAKSLHYICRAIAISTDTPFVRIVSRALSELPPKDIRTLWEMLMKRCDPDSFFFIMVSAKGMRRLKSTKPPDEPKAETQSSDVSP